MSGFQQKNCTDLTGFAPVKITAELGALDLGKENKTKQTPKQ